MAWRSAARPSHWPATSWLAEDTAVHSVRDDQHGGMLEELGAGAWLRGITIRVSSGVRNALETDVESKLRRRARAGTTLAGWPSQIIRNQIWLDWLVGRAEIDCAALPSYANRQKETEKPRATAYHDIFAILANASW
ncbi:hypothetical protein BT67DRAFT_96071 [Trichocladium antarcticum]|uniref:Uncharacterized protein n=1 Tax=Trichocladium antarcticum TaxID=1450529 RepID=A0AAN6ZFF3_9PEZI|nr:hypothetical protein BT67DRAFT_96071 [Trichocladium antarcticum]